MSGRTFTEMLAALEEILRSIHYGPCRAACTVSAGRHHYGQGAELLAGVADSRVGVRLVPDRRHHQAAEMEAGKYLSPAPVSLNGTP